MPPTSAPDLPDIDKVLQMTKDMELISDFLTNGRFVGDRVYVSIEHLAECIRNTRPQSEASALATPVGWIKTTDRLPEKPCLKSYEYVDCLIYHRGKIKQRPWNCEHLCWDDEHYDDFYCAPTDPTHWQPLPAPPHTEERG